MRTLMIANAIVSNSTFNAAGGIEFESATGTKFNGSNTTALKFKEGEYLSISNNLNVKSSVEDASWKRFLLNPRGFSYTFQKSGTDTVDFSTITYPTGNYSLPEPFLGGIVIKQHDQVRNIFKTLKIVEFETSLVAWADIQAAIVAKLNTLTTFITRVSDTKYNHVLNDITVEFIGSLNVIRNVKTFGEKAVIKGEDIARLELEFSPNSGGGQFLQENYSYSDSNLIANKSAVYDTITITNRMPSERALFPESAGLETTLVIAVPTTSTNVADQIIALLKAVKTDPSGEVVTETENA